MANGHKHKSNATRDLFEGGAHVRPLNPQDWLNARDAVWDAFANSATCPQCKEHGGWHGMVKNDDGVWVDCPLRCDSVREAC